MRSIKAFECYGVVLCIVLFEVKFELFGDGFGVDSDFQILLKDMS